MKKVYKTGLIIIVSITIIFTGLVFNGLILMADEDRYVDITNFKKELHDGDIIFQTSKSAQSKAIQFATKSKYSHIGLIYMKDKEIYVLEASQTVALTPFESWIKRGYNEHYVIKRLKDSDNLLTSEIRQKMNHIGEGFIGKNYDVFFEWSDDRIYCSELIWKIYKKAANIELGKLEFLKDLNLNDKIVKQKLLERFGEKIPLEETIISPVSIFNSDKLITIYQE
jgi:uncharacterized protein YycO